MRKPLTLVTLALVILNVLVYVATIRDPSLVTRYGLIPAMVPTEPFRLVTSMFLHASIMHIFFNMFVLWSLASSFEGRMGPIRFTVLYLLGGLGGSLLVWAASPPHTTTVGASGAIFALFGALLVLAKDNPGALKSVLAVVGINLIFTFASPGVSWQGHVGGLATGLVLGFLLYTNDRSKKSMKSGQAPQEPAITGYNENSNQWRR